VNLPFDDRRHAGRVLAERLASSVVRPGDDVLVLALPRGGVPVAFEVAIRLRAPMDVFVVRKLGLPGREELAMGAVASGGTPMLDRRLLDSLRVSDDAVARVIDRERTELARREHVYRGGRGPLDLEGRTVLLVDDGLATGSTMRAAATAVRSRHPSRLIVAVPVGAPESCADLEDVADDVVCASEPQPFTAVGLWYRDFSQTTDDEVRELLGAWSGDDDRTAQMNDRGMHFDRR
jgi:putative phosphoribosyl transferase